MNYVIFHQPFELLLYGVVIVLHYMKLFCSGYIHRLKIYFLGVLLLRIVILARVHMFPKTRSFY